MFGCDEIFHRQLVPLGNGQQRGTYGGQPGGRARILCRPEPRLGWPMVGNMHRRERALGQPRCDAERIQPADLGSLGLAAGECGNLTERGAIRVLGGGQFGDRYVWQDLARCPVQPLGYRVTGVPQLRDVREATTAVYVMDARRASAHDHFPVSASRTSSRSRSSIKSSTSRAA